RKQLIEQPVITVSYFVGLTGLLLPITVLPLRRYYGAKRVQEPPKSFPLPDRPRVADLSTPYDD
ncbi:hypothetical protein M427DRAFT_152700, partial [Gonapodya prolifera JEL478]